MASTAIAQLPGLMPLMSLGGLSLSHCLILSVILFALGVYGVVSRRNAMIMLLSIEIMLNAANLGALSFARHLEGRALELAAQRESLDAQRSELQDAIRDLTARNQNTTAKRVALTEVQKLLGYNHMSRDNALAVGHTGHILSLFVMAIAAAEAAVGLALLIALVRHKDSVDTRDLHELRE